MRVLVIGGSGFIGTRLVEQLQGGGHTVVNYDLRQSSRYPELTQLGDVRETAGIVEAARGCEAIVLLAAEHRDDVRPLSLYEEVNVQGAARVTEAAQALGIRRIVFTSSVALYGLGKQSPSEQTAPEPFNEYGRTKLAAEQVLTTWAEADPQRSLFVVRPSVVFGEGNRGNVYTLARQIAGNRFLFVGPGRNRKSMSYVGNIAAYLASGLSAETGISITNYADKPDLTTRELVSTIRRELGKGSGRGPALPLWLGMAAGHAFDLLGKVAKRSFPISAIRIRKFAAETTIDTRRLAQSGFVPPFDVAQALHRTLAHEFPGGKIPQHTVSDLPSGSDG